MKIRSLQKRKLSSALAAGVLSLSLGASAMAGDATHDEGMKGEIRDAWIDGKLEASYTLNGYLNPFAINTDVENGVVMLTGTVESQVDKDLAEEIAKGLDGVTSVENKLMVEPDSRSAEADSSANRSFGEMVDDATTTARVKFALLEDDSTEGLKINVDTERGHVRLEGEVQTEQHRELAQKIAANTEGVQSVENQLKISGQS